MVRFLITLKEFSLFVFSIEEFDVKVFESVYLDNDHFSLLSNTKSDYIGQNEKFILVGARYVFKDRHLVLVITKEHFC
jgi:hypothetical protein